jgi:hypothetical protein
MSRKLSIVLVVAALGLAGCVAVPYEPYGYAPAPVVAPSVSFGYYSGPYYGHRHHRHRHPRY